MNMIARKRTHDAEQPADGHPPEGLPLQAERQRKYPLIVGILFVLAVSVMFWGLVALVLRVALR